MHPDKALFVPDWRLKMTVRLASKLALTFAAFWMVCSTAPAAQFVMFDVTFPFTKEEADNSKPSQSHYYIKEDRLNPNRPVDWTAPIDYRNGTVHVRLEVLEKPAGGEPTQWSICYMPNKGQQHGYGCIGTGNYKEKGVYEKDISMRDFWQNDNIVWTDGIKRMDVVMKDGKGVHAHKSATPEKFFPTKIRLTLIQVSAGSKYDPSLVPNLPKKTATTDASQAQQLAQSTSKPAVGNAPDACCGSK